MGKILRGQTRELHQSEEIITQKDAYDNGFYGKVNCEECGFWRVILETHYNPHTDSFTNPTLSCFKCGKTTTPPPVKLRMSTPTPQIDKSGTV